MRNANLRGHPSRSYRQNPSSLKYIYLLIGVCVVIFFGMKIFGGTSATPVNAGKSLSLTAYDNKTQAYILQDDEKKTTLSVSGALYENNGTLHIESGGVTAKLGASFFDMSTNTQLQYTTPPSTQTSDMKDTLKVTRGSLWVDSSSENLHIELNNFSAKVPTGTIVMFEQNALFSSAYAIRGDVQIFTDVGQYTLTPGQKLSLSEGEVKNAQTKLSEKVHDFDSSVAKMELFVKNDGETLLKASLEQNAPTIQDEKNSETTSSTVSGATVQNSGKYVAFTQPVDGSTIKTATTVVMGNILSPEVSRVTINDMDAVVSPVNENFTMENFTLEKGINNIVYKVYSQNGIELDRGVLVVHGNMTAQKVNTIIPENFPNSADFVITAPASNPFATTESYVRVQGRVPAKTVKYITVNGYRLQKFIPNSTTWYYHANASIGTIKEGTNLYHIKFYDANDREIHTQIFTIIKDSTNATTNKPDNGEIAPLFPTT